MEWSVFAKISGACRGEPWSKQLTIITRKSACQCFLAYVFFSLALWLLASFSALLVTCRGHVRLAEALCFKADAASQTHESVNTSTVELSRQNLQHDHDGAAGASTDLASCLQGPFPMRSSSFQECYYLRHPELSIQPCFRCECVVALQSARGSG